MNSFDRIIDRSGTGSMKWERYAGKDILPLWVADMDFATPAVVLDAVRRELDHEIMGYPVPRPSQTAAVIEWLEKKHGWKTRPEWFIWLPGVVPALHVALRAYLKPGEKALINAPVYPPFITAPDLSGRDYRDVPFRLKDGTWQIDAAEFADAAKETPLHLLCSPHNPVGRVFSRAELEEMAKVWLANDMVICSDEIHCDLVLDKKTPHIVTATLSPEIESRTVTLMAPSKTWNVPGLCTAFAIIPDAGLRLKFQRTLKGIVPDPNVLGLVACEAAYRHGGPWLDELKDYLRGNLDYMMNFFAARLPELTIWRPEATYLAWIDCRKLGVASPKEHFESFGVGLHEGALFNAPGYLRINFGCPRSTLVEALHRMEKAVEVKRG